MWLSVGAISALAAAISLYLTYAHYKLRADAGWQSLCDVSAQFSCGAVAASEYSSLAGIPIAWFGTVFYAALGWLALRARRGDELVLPRSPALALAAAGTLATALSLILALVSALVVNSFCPMCVVLYGCNATLLVLGVVALRREPQRLQDLLRAERRALRRNGPAAAMMAFLALVALVALPFVLSMRPPLRGLCEYLAGRGGEKADLVIYTDYQCPFCKRADLTLESFRTRPGVTVSVRNYPLDRECNPALKRTIHPGACLQASAVLCAEPQGRERTFGRRVFETSAKDFESLLRVAKDLGMDARAFEACLGAPETAKRLAADIEAAEKAGVNATPTLFVDGRRYQGSLDPAALDCPSQPELPSSL